MQSIIRLGCLEINFDKLKTLGPQKTLGKKITIIFWPKLVLDFICGVSNILKLDLIFGLHLFWGGQPKSIYVLL